MKKTVLALALTLSASVMAQPQGFNGNNNPMGGSVQGFSNAQLPSFTVKQVIQNGYDDQLVSLKGRIIAQLSPELYTFKDEQGDQINIELDDDRSWAHLQKNQLITIIGEVDRDAYSIKIDVKQATAAQ